MKRTYSLIVVIVLLLTVDGFSQSGQINIDRINLMPDMPQPYQMRNWKEVAVGYDAFVFDKTKTGDHLPLVGIKNSGINYPDLKPILLDTYVGTSSSSQAEAINIIPAMVGALLNNVDKSNQFGENWVSKVKDFYNSENGENVYLNAYSATSGHDWWYDLMPNVFFYQLTTLYSTDPDFDSQFISIADQWLNAVNAMGGKTTPWTTPAMDYRAWDLTAMTGNAAGVHEPEASGAIAWILYSAYQKTSEKKYLEGAQMCLEFLSGLSENPSYELQLPYGTLTAAKLNAVLKTNYDVDKMLNWSFDRGALRGWGTIVGKWDNKDVSGLIGEANDNGNDYAFLMNGYQQAAALVPLIMYDKRYARAISKWVLNLANASRLFYPQFLDQAKQDDYVWSNQYDPQSFIAYEALKENWEAKALYGTGDAKRSGWAATNLGLYGSSHVGYLASIVETTDVEGILALNLNSTDFFGANPYQAFAYYNPFSVDHLVTVPLGVDAKDLYDAISETKIATNVSGNHQVLVKAGEVLLLTWLPANAILVENNNILYHEGNVVDYHYGYEFSPAFRLKSFSAEATIVEFNEQVNIFAAVENAPGDVSYNWYLNDEWMATTDTGHFLWTAPGTEGDNKISVEIVSGTTLNAEVTIQVVPFVPKPPQINSISQDQVFYYEGDPAKIICHAEEASTEKLTYEWQVPTGAANIVDSLLTWTTPSEGLYEIECTVTNINGLSSYKKIQVLIKNESLPAVEALAYYPLNIDTKDYSGHDYDAVAAGVDEAPDALGNPNLAYGFSSGDDIIYVPNATALNFADEITVACWVVANAASHEAFVLSHGSWEERWKISITPERKLRWTVKTSVGVKDLDSDFALIAGTYYHITANYTGYSMELYIDGELNGYTSLQGTMLSTAKSITFGQKSESATQYFLNGIIDEVKIFNSSLQPWQIATLKEMWHEEVTATATAGSEIRVYPNPVESNSIILSTPYSSVKGLELSANDGRNVEVRAEPDTRGTSIFFKEGLHGMFVLKVKTQATVKHFKIVIK